MARNHTAAGDRLKKAISDDQCDTNASDPTIKNEFKRNSGMLLESVKHQKKLLPNNLAHIASLYPAHDSTSQSITNSSNQLDMVHMVSSSLLMTKKLMIKLL